MRHGGARKGSGRPRRLAWEERLCVAEAYRTAVREEAIRIHKERNPGFSELDGLYDHLEAVPLEVRRQRLKDPTKLGDGDEPMDDAIGDIADVISNRFGGSRLITISLACPYGARPGLLAKIAREATDYYGVKVTPRLVEACLEDYRAWQEEEAQQEAQSET